MIVLMAAWLAAASPAPDAATIDSRALDRSITEVLAQPEFSWRLPRQEREEKRQEGVIGRFVREAVEWIGRTLKEILHKIADGIGWILEKIREWMPKYQPLDDKPATDWRMRKLLFASTLIFAAAIALGALLLRWTRQWRRSARTETVAVEPAPAVDITEEHVDAQRLPEEGWLAMARELAAKGELRLAMRALHLAVLVRLAHHELIALERFKTDREYERELDRRARDRETLRESFHRNLDVFEAAWYGDRFVTADALDAFAATAERIRAHAA